MHCIICIVFSTWCCFHYLQCIEFCALHYIHCIICFIIHALYSMYCILSFVFYILYSMNCILFLVFDALYYAHCMHCMYSIQYILVPMYFELTLKLVGHRPTDRPTDGRTLSDIELLSHLKTKKTKNVRDPNYEYV